MTRFLMSLQESVELVKHAFLHAEPGDLFVKKAPASTVDTLARAVAGLFGDDEPDVRVIGMRHGEKLHETLLSAARSSPRPRTRATSSACRSTPAACSTRSTSPRARTTVSHVEDYASDNTQRLDIEATQDLLRTIPEVQRGAGDPMRIVLTGAEGFLGWHTRCLLHATTDHTVVAVGRDTWSQLPGLVADADAVIHVAGINRADDSELVDGNVALAADVATAVRAAGRPVSVVFANSIQVGNGSPYADGQGGRGRRPARRAPVRPAAPSPTCSCPNLFGEHGRPGYNSFVASFVDAVISGERAVDHRPADRPAARPGGGACAGVRPRRPRRRAAPPGHRDDRAARAGRRFGASTRRTPSG